MLFKHRKIGIWGLGVVGSSAVRFFHKQNAAITVMDIQQPDEEQQAFLAAHNARFIAQSNLSDFFAYNDAVLASPGINIHAFDVPPNTKWLNELDIFHHFWKKQLIAITGSIGKTSVTHLLSACLRAAGKRVAVGGNIGTGMLDILEQQEESDYAVLEVSSFQLEECATFAPTLAIWTNLFANHLDRHATVQAYFDAKYAIMARQKPTDCAIVHVSLADMITKKEIIPHIFWYNDAEHTDKDPLYYATEAGVYRKAAGVHYQLLKASALPHSSFLSNWILITAALDRLKIPVTVIEETEYTLPEHRLEPAGAIAGARFFNDSKSTTMASTLAAMNKFKDDALVLFLGGTSKGVDRRLFVQEVSARARLLYCFGVEAQQLHSAAIACPTYAFETLDEAFGHYIRNNLDTHDIVLFSPSGASYDLFKNYQERGNYFKALVARYAQTR